MVGSKVPLKVPPPTSHTNGPLPGGVLGREMRPFWGPTAARTLPDESRHSWRFVVWPGCARTATGSTDADCGWITFRAELAGHCATVPSSVAAIAGATRVPSG